MSRPTFDRTLRPDETGVDKRWRGLGIRIEDNVVITKDEPLNLTDSLVRNPDDIERLMAEKPA